MDQLSFLHGHNFNLSQVSVNVDKGECWVVRIILLVSVFLFCKKPFKLMLAEVQ